MMDWTDRHCRFFHRLLTRRALLYTEMMTADAHPPWRPRSRLLASRPEEHPVALQLGGSDPARSPRRARSARARLRRDQPQRRLPVRSRAGGAVRRLPDGGARPRRAMRRRHAGGVRIPVTVKCRIGIDEQDSEPDLERFIATVAGAGCRTFIVHARKAWLARPVAEREPRGSAARLPRVYRLKAAHPELTIVINGGIGSLVEAEAHLAHVDGACSAEPPITPHICWPRSIAACSGARLLLRRAAPASPPNTKARARIDPHRHVLAGL